MLVAFNCFIFLDILAFDQFISTQVTIIHFGKFDCGLFYNFLNVILMMIVLANFAVSNWRVPAGSMKFNATFLRCLILYIKMQLIANTLTYSILVWILFFFILVPMCLSFQILLVTILKHKVIVLCKCISFLLTKICWLSWWYKLSTVLLFELMIAICTSIWYVVCSILLCK